MLLNPLKARRYTCSGIGDTFAYTLLRNYYSGEMEIRKGKLVTYRVIRHAVDVGAYSLGEPVDVWVMKLMEIFRLVSFQKMRQWR
jgi:20S proteasome alpha/beta subunit